MSVCLSRSGSRFYVKTCHQNNHFFRFERSVFHLFAEG